MSIAAVVLAVSAVFASILAWHLIRVHRAIKKRHEKPALPLTNDPHRAAFAFILQHGVEAYNRARQQQRQNGEPLELQPPPAHHVNPRTLSLNGSITSSGGASLAGSEPLPEYSPPSNGLVIIQGMGAVRLSGGVHGSESTTTALRSELTGIAGEAIVVMDYPPMYTYQAPMARSQLQGALATSDNAPSITVNLPQPPPPAASASSDSESEIPNDHPQATGFRRPAIFRRGLSGRSNESSSMANGTATPAASAASTASGTIPDIATARSSPPPSITLSLAPESPVLSPSGATSCSSDS